MARGKVLLNSFSGFLAALPSNTSEFLIYDFRQYEKRKTIDSFFKPIGSTANCINSYSINRNHRKMLLSYETCENTS
jgi:hypothetical protein